MGEPQGVRVTLSLLQRVYGETERGKREWLSRRNPASRSRCLSTMAKHWARAVLVCSSLGIVLVPRPCVATEDAAREHYRKALQLVDAGKLEEAKAAFESAYAESPHFVVLFNLGRVSYELSDLGAARTYLKLYLAQGGDQISPERRQAALALIERIDTELATQARVQEEATEERIPPPSTGSAPDVAIAVTEIKPPGPPSVPGTPEAEPAPPPVTDRGDAWLVLAATGGVLLATGAGVWVWNRARLSRAREERSALAEQRPPQLIFPEDQDALDDALRYRADLQENDAKFDSVRRFNIVAGTAAVAGALMISAGAALYLTTDATEERIVAIGPRQVTLRIRF